MTSNSRSYTVAATLIFVLAALHLSIAALAFAGYGMLMIVVAVLWALLALGLMRQRRWCAYLAFLGVIFSASAALSGAFQTYEVVAILFWLIVVTYLLEALVLFGIIWSGPRSKYETA